MFDLSPYTKSSAIDRTKVRFADVMALKPIQKEIQLNLLLIDYCYLEKDEIWFSNKF